MHAKPETEITKLNGLNLGTLRRSWESHLGQMEGGRNRVPLASS
ncbi:MAG: hypothetical protein VCF07_09330 [Nitrospinota bacterium]